MKGIKCTSNDVNAILAGDKGQIRLVIKHQPSHPNAEFAQTVESTNKKDENTCRWVVRTDPYYIDESLSSKRFKWPHQIGDLVFVKESFTLEGRYENPLRNYASEVCTDYRANYSRYEDKWCKWKPAQHMKQHQSRITLRIKDISVERLQDISREDCLKEGKDQWEFICDWNATHKKPEEKWEANPWIWKIEFEVVK